MIPLWSSEHYKSYAQRRLDWPNTQKLNQSVLPEDFTKQSAEEDEEAEAEAATPAMKPLKRPKRNY